MSKSKISIKTVMFYVTFTLSALCCGKIFDGALSFGMFVGAVYSGNVYVAALCFLAASAVFGVNYFIQAGVRAGVIVLFVLIHKLAKKKIIKSLLLLYLVAANVFYCIYNTSDNFQLFDKLLYSACGIAFSFVSIYFFRAVFARGLSYRPALDEAVCICFFAVAISYGLSTLTVWELSAVYFVIPFALLVMSHVFGDKETLVCAAVLGLGNLLATGAYDCVAFSMFSAVSVIACCRLNRFVSGLSVVLVDVLMSYFLNLHGSFSTLVFVPTLCSVLVFFVIPSGVYNYLKDCVCGNYERYLGKSVVKKLGMYTAKRLYRLSDIFLSMKTAFLTMSAGALTGEQAQKAIVKGTIEAVCRTCPERSRCWRTDSSTEESMLQLAECAVQRGKCTILDVPQSLSLKCARVSTLLAELNVQTNAFKEYADRVEQANSGKKLLGEQLGGVSQLLTQLAGDCKGKVSYSSEKEKELVERLVFHNILCCGAVIMDQGGIVSAIVTVAKKDFDESIVEQIASQLLGQNIVVEKTENSENGNTWLNVHLGVKPRYTVSFGVAAATKDGSEISGDTHTVLKTDNGKCIVALCDGMGSGDKAETMSATSIGLVENFYRAGFDNDTILSCVNHLLVGSGNEIFCAVDICVFDLTNGLTDFIKLGAPVGLVKCENTVEIVNGSSLPLGVLDEMKPSITKKALQTNDMTVLFSDGVTDCFNDPNALAQIFAETSCTNPQSVAEVIMTKTLRACGGKPKDDMTVVVAKIV